MTVEPLQKTRAARPRILVLTSTFPRWESDVEPGFVYELSRRLTGVFEVLVVAPHAAGSKAEEVMDGVYVHRFRYAPAGWEGLAYRGGILENLKKRPVLWALVPILLTAQLLTVCRLLKRRPIQVIHCHWIFPQALVALLARWLTGSRAKILCTSHGSDLYGLKGRFFDGLRRRILRKCDQITAVSRAMRSDLLRSGADPQEVSVIPMGVDLQQRFVPPERRSEALSLIFVGRLIEIKGLRYLLQAMPRILEKFPDADLKIVGEGPQREELETFANRQGLQDRVEFLGAIRNTSLPELYQKAWMLVFPSVGPEGFGLVPVEALGCECVPVVSAQPSVMDIVQHGKTGMVVPPGNPEQLAKAIIELGHSPSLRSAMARAGRQHVLAHFDWSVIAAKYQGTIRRMAGF